MTTRRVVIAMTVGVLALAGCGEDDDGGGGSGGLNQTELERQSATICKAGDEALAQIKEPQDFTQPEQAAEYLGSVVETADGVLDDLRGLDPQESLQAEYDAYLDALEESRDFLAGVQEKAEAKDPSGLEDLTAELQDGGLQKATVDAANAAGLKGCAATG